MQRFVSSSRFFVVGLFALLAAACAVPTYRAGEPCRAIDFSVEDGFSGARRGKCTVLSENSVRLDIRPESTGKINDSPWYAFKLIPSAPTTAIIKLRYHNGHHRYWPKISTDGLSWVPLNAAQVSVSNRGRRATIEVPLDADTVWVSAQEIISPAVYDAWSRKTATAAGLSLREIGRSKRDLPILSLDNDSAARDVLLLIGRQHPPEVSGAFAFLAFAETIYGDSELANRFRNRFRVLAIPILNPDGVIGGNWRHNLGGADLNRDWGLFLQPETRHVASLLDALDESGSMLRMFVDFHSTQKNVFYTQSQQTEPPNFTQTWLENARTRISDYPFLNDKGPGENDTVAKNYFFNRYSIPAITFEVGDETDRIVVRAAAEVFAQELMKLMLDQEY